MWLKNHPRILDRLGMRVFLGYLKTKEGGYRNWDAIRAWAGGTRPLLLQ